MPGGVRAQPSRSRLGPGDDDSGDDLARSSIDPEDVTAYQEVVYRPPRENDSECDSDEVVRHRRTRLIYTNSVTFF